MSVKFKKVILKIKISSLFVLIVTSLTNAQVNLYDFTRATTTYSPITGGTIIATATASSGAGSLDDVLYTLPTGTIPFAFNFDNINYTGFVLSTNGFITFGATNPAVNLYVPLSSTTAYSGAISPIGGDLNSYFISGNSSQTGEIRYQTLGASPNRTFVVQYRNFRPKSSATAYGAAINFQIRLYETTNRVEFIYSTSGSFTTTTNYQVGLRGPNNAFPSNLNNRSVTSGTNNWSTSAYGSSITSSCPISPTLFPPSGLVFRFTPTLCTAPIGGFVSLVGSTSATLNWTNIGTGGTFKIEYGPVGFTLGTGTIVNTSSTSQQITGLNVGTQYSFYVQRICGGTSGNSTVSGPFNFSTGALGEECSTAVNLNVSTSCSYTLVNSGLSINGPISNCSDVTGNQIKNDVWYKFTAPSNGSKIIITTQAGTVNDWVMELWSGGCPGTGSVEKCGDDQNAFMPEIQLCQNEYVGGQVYYIRTWTYNPSLSGTMNLCVYQTAACPLPPANDNCLTATSLSINPPTGCPTNATTFTTLNATSTTEPASCDAASGKRDVWFTFNTGNFGNLLLTISPLTATNLKAQLFFECGGFEISCYNPANGSYILTGLNPQADYELRVWTDAAGMGTFKICLADICEDPTAQISGSVVMCAGATAPLQVNLTGFSPWTFVYNNGVSNQTVTTSTSPYTLNVSPTVSTNYNLVSVNSLYCAGTVSGTGTVSLLPTPVVTLADFSPVCENTITTLTGGSPSGGTYSGTGVQSGSLNGSLAGVGTYQITYTFGQGLGCQRSATKPITVLKAPAITGFSPSTAPVGSNVAISGLNLAEVNSVKFNNLSATQYTVINDFAVHATVPVSATTGLLKVTNSFGCSSSTVDPFAVGTPAPGANLTIKVFMQGYYAGSNNMYPVTDPINAPSHVDTITVELHSVLPPYGLITSRKGPINTSGNGTFIFPSIYSGNSYYLVIKHRNSIETWSKQPISLPLGGSNYNFTVNGSTQRSLLPNILNHKEVIPVSE